MRLDYWVADADWKLCLNVSVHTSLLGLSVASNCNCHAKDALNFVLINK